VIGCAIAVHRELGPGLLEAAYEQCLAHELALNDIPFELQKVMPVDCKGVQMDCGYRVDLLVDERRLWNSKRWLRSSLSTKPSC
jgi:GxxExxY protein